MDRGKLIRLYVDEGLTLSAAADQLGCSLTTAWRYVVASGVTCREPTPRYARTAFGGNTAEKAYLTGLRIGDLHVAMEGTPS